MNRLNKVQNLILMAIIIFIIIISLFRFLEPFFYNNKTNGKDLNNYDDYNYLRYALNTYLSGYTDEDFEQLKQCTSYFKRLSDSEYESIYNTFIKDKYKKIEVINIKKSINDVYIVEYSVNMNTNDITFEDPQKHRIIVKLFKSKQIFKIYYDSMIDEL